ncbi:decapping enzyme Dcp1 like [Lecanosticta acicola]|uniref:Decapping enzyme Dcp1 like n=1 Tax=Lecanosticta acicola TaxID=111012 RepID=A0AAI9EE62_9PEZI|nr:decapping enzyme Dcp1 like [Lecanosticta acicola]
MTVFVPVDFGNPPSPEGAKPYKKKMTAKQRNAQAHRAPPPKLPPASDYDTDAANYTDNAAQQIAVAASPPDRTNEELNMLVLKRWYPDIEHILAIAPFAVIYSCHPETGQWDKCDIQGSLFVCQIAAQPGGYPGFKAIILNRRHMENWELRLVSTDDIEVTKEFVICTVLEKEQGENGEAYETPRFHGIWMFQDTEGGKEVRDRVVKVLLECAEQAEQFAQLAGEETAEENGHGQGYGQYEYGLDGMPTGQTFHAEQQRYEEPAQQLPQQLPQQAPSMAGQQIDLATLFGKPQQAQQGPVPLPQGYGEAQPARFTPSADTDFFRGSPNPASQQQQQQQAPQQAVQQNALLDLFKNAKRG